MILYEAKAIRNNVFLINDNVEVPVPDCKILGRGKAESSSGIIIADQNRFWYVPLASQNLEDTITKITDICDKIKSICSTLSSSSSLLDNGTTVVGTASIVPSVIVGTQISEAVSSISAEVDTIKTELNEIKQSIV